MCVSVCVCVFFLNQTICCILCAQQHNEGGGGDGKQRKIRVVRSELRLHLDRFEPIDNPKAKEGSKSYAWSWKG